MTPKIRGPRLIVGLYALIVAFAGVAGYTLGHVVPGGPTAVRLFFLLSLPPTPLGLAIFGAVTIAVALGAVLVLVALVSHRAERRAERR